MEKELSEICSSILQLLDDHLIPTASSGESKVFYLKMKGDYHRYLAEFKSGTDRKDAAEHTLLAYKAAQVRKNPSCLFSLLALSKKPTPRPEYGSTYAACRCMEARRLANGPRVHRASLYICLAPSAA